jgi:phosphoribosylformylglycinamidine (FGAM) synthase PurS component
VRVALTDTDGREVVEVQTTRALVLGIDEISEETAQRRLLDFVEPLLRSSPLAST